MNSAVFLTRPSDRVKRIEDEAVGADLSSWKRFEFLPNIKTRYFLSPKQEAILCQIEKRLGLPPR